MKKLVFGLLSGALLLAFAVSCGSGAKMAQIKKDEAGASLELSNETYVPDVTIPEAMIRKADTITVTDDEGRKFILMKTFKDKETGEETASEVLDAAVVTARFRNLAERQGKVDIAFQIVVPERMQDSKWQLRFYPDMFVLEDSIRLDPVIITGKDYRKAQLRGYQQYNKFLDSIISDTTRFVDLRSLEIFLQRNIPQIFAFKSDTSYVSDEEFMSFYGVSERDAIDHYTNKYAKAMNERRKGKIDQMREKYIKVPIVTEGIRLDTVIMMSNGDFIYNYVQTINTRPKMKKVDVVLSGEIFEKEQKLYDIPKCPPLTFYISTLSAFAIDFDRYMTKVIQRRAYTNTASHIDFELGRSEVIPSLGKNEEEIEAIRENITMLLDNNIFDLDSIIVSATASPEGSVSTNRALAQSRSVSVSNFFNKYIKHYTDSLNRYGGFSISLSSDVKAEDKHLGRVDFTPRCIPENWEDLSRYIAEDDTLTTADKDRYVELQNIDDLDARERTMQAEPWYKYVKDKYYPSLRTVKFDFYLHRKGMVKDTVNTTELDSNYIKGVLCLKDMDYAEALEYLRPYNDFNTAVAYTALNRNTSAMMILSPMDRTAEVNYLLAILYSRLGEDQKAVECYLKACKQKDIYVHRGNLDPEISHLIKLYNLNKVIDEMFSFDYSDLY
ncbi:MAG: hypothetical protein MJY41_00830 [Bacteroidales bacterium]|nr:hypothetical protein [Bacteroidales bacterium]